MESRLTAEPTHRIWAVGWFVWMMEGPMVTHFTRDPALQVSVLRDCFQRPGSCQEVGRGGEPFLVLLAVWLPYPQRNCCSWLWRSVWVCECVCMRSRGTRVSVGGACVPLYEYMKISKLYNTLLMEMLIHWSQNDLTVFRKTKCASYRIVMRFRIS